LDVETGAGVGVAFVVPPRVVVVVPEVVWVEEEGLADEGEFKSCELQATAPTNNREYKTYFIIYILSLFNVKTTHRNLTTLYLKRHFRPELPQFLF
jgi:hypothetical protein